MKKLILSCLLIAGISSFCYSQTKRQDIIRLLEVSNVRSQASQMFDLMLPDLITLAPNAPSAFWNSFKSRLDIDSFVNLFIPIYDRYFSHDDIRSLIEFYESPIGRRLLDVTPSMSQESYRIGQEWGEKTAIDIINELIKQGYFNN